MNGTKYLVSVEKGKDYSEFQWVLFMQTFEKLLSDFDLVGYIAKERGSE